MARAAEQDPPQAVSVVFGIDSVLERLRRALPAEHPVVKQVSDTFDAMVNYIEVRGEPETEPNLREFIERDHDAFVVLLEDWRRGIRDWDEVEEALKDLRYFRDGLDKAQTDASAARKHPA